MLGEYYTWADWTTQVFKEEAMTNFAVSNSKTSKDYLQKLRRWRRVTTVLRKQKPNREAHFDFWEFIKRFFWECLTSGRWLKTGQGVWKFDGVFL